MSGKTISEMANWLGDASEKCKKIRHFIIRLLPGISFLFGLFPLVYRKKVEDNNSGEVIPSSFGSLAGCIREGFDCPEKLAMYHIKIKQELTSRVLTHKNYNEEGMAEASEPIVESYDDLFKRVWKILNNKK